MMMMKAGRVVLMQSYYEHNLIFEDNRKVPSYQLYVGLMNLQFVFLYEFSLTIIALKDIKIPQYSQFTGRSVAVMTRVDKGDQIRPGWQSALTFAARNLSKYITGTLYHFMLPPRKLTVN